MVRRTVKALVHLAMLGAAIRPVTHGSTCGNLPDIYNPSTALVDSAENHTQHTIHHIIFALAAKLGSAHK